MRPKSIDWRTILREHHGHLLRHACCARLGAFDEHAHGRHRHVDGWATAQRKAGLRPADGRDERELRTFVHPVKGGLRMTRIITGAVLCAVAIACTGSNSTPGPPGPA